LRAAGGSVVRYAAGIVPDDSTQIPRFLKQELTTIQSSLNTLADGQLDLTTVAPTRPRAGMIRYADGTNWDPGSGEGVYFYFAGGWNFAGGGSGGGSPFSTDIVVHGLTVGRGLNAGSTNTCLGINALAATTSGTDNVVVGANSGDSITSGSFNVAVGSNTMAALSTGSNNIAMGNGAMANASGTIVSNIAIGTDALADTTGSVNLAIGDSALASNTSGVGNIAVGVGALSSNTTGDRNISIGTNGAQLLASADDNISIGESALAANTAGNQNISIGTQSLVVATGSSNVAVGYLAGLLATTGSNNVFLGNGADGAAITDSNVITLGNSSIATIRAQVTSITSLSDARDKTDIADLDYGLDFLQTLRPVSFTWNMRDGGKVGVKDSGFIAQELKWSQDKYDAADYLKLVYESNPEKLEASYGRLIPVLVKAIQELKSEFDNYKLTHS
jgi:trimeric autotransporter adhesin